MATSDATRSLPLLGSYVELLEHSERGTRRVFGKVTAVVVAADGCDEYEALAINGDFWHLFNCEIVRTFSIAA